MKTYNFNNCNVTVFNCPAFRIAKVYDKNGKYVSEIMTSAYGKRAAEIAVSEAMRFRYI